MARHAKQDDSKQPQGKRDDGPATYIGRHRHDSAVVDDPQGWSVGRGVARDNYER